MYAKCSSPAAERKPLITAMSIARATPLKFRRSVFFGENISSRPFVACLLVLASSQLCHNVCLFTNRESQCARGTW